MKKFLLDIAIISFCFSCNKSNQPPVGLLVIFPNTGDTSVIFEFHAGGSTDDIGYPIGLMFRWDIDGDGVWDSGFDHDNTFAHKYEVPGNYLVKLEVKDLDGLTSIAQDTVRVYGQNADISTFIDSRDGNQYRTVKIDGSWWMAENLKYGKLIPKGQEQTENDTVERYQYTDWKTCDTIGGVYSWFEAMNYEVGNPKGICPDGWHIPSYKEWIKIFESYPISYAHKYFGENGLSGLNLHISNSGWSDDEISHEDWGVGGFWTTSYALTPTAYNVCRILYAKVGVGLTGEYWETVRTYTHPHLVMYYSVRCKMDN
jgi:uncharacterized protein (TIGR02145 family)